LPLETKYFPPSSPDRREIAPGAPWAAGRQGVGQRRCRGARPRARRSGPPRPGATSSASERFASRVGTALPAGASRSSSLRGSRSLFAHVTTGCTRGTFIDRRNAQDRLRSRPITGAGLAILVADLRGRIAHHEPTHAVRRRPGRPRTGEAPVPITSTERSRALRRRRAAAKGWQALQLRVHPDDAAALRRFAARLARARRGRH